MDTFFKDFMQDVPRGDSTRYLRQQKVPQARWMRLSEIAASPLLTYDPRKPGKKILIGALGKHLVGIEDDRHVMTVGLEPGIRHSHVCPRVYRARGRLLEGGLCTQFCTYALRPGLSRHDGT